MRLKEFPIIFNETLCAVYGENEAQALFFVALDHVLGYSRAEYILRKNDELPSESSGQLLRILNELKEGRPLQYVIGETEFFGLSIKVNESVLIPRPETEELVEWILDTIQSTGEKKMKILDVGTGSGCIALALKKHLPESILFALDISDKALSVCNDNSTLNQLSINIVNADIRRYRSEHQFDVIVSNPPYVTSDERVEMSEHVLKYEPHLALFVGNENPLEFYIAIAEFALSNLTDHGRLFFEINENFGKDMVDMLAIKGFKNIELKKDMQGKNRMIKCSRF